MNTFKIYTLGCKVNQYDTESIRERFLRRGFKEIDNGQMTDICIINTCTVTSTADRKSKETIRHCIKANPQAKVIVTGCLAEKDDIFLSQIKGIDLIISKKFFPEGITNFSGHTRAFLKVQDGCNNLCSYCKVPLVRGPSKSRPLDEIVREANELVKNGFTPLETRHQRRLDVPPEAGLSLTGFKEIVLSGISLGAYGRDLNPALNLVSVIKALENIEGLLRIRLSSLEMLDISDELIDKMSASKKLCPHLHIPLQSGDDKILKKMNRRYTFQSYLNLIQRIKARIPEIAITTDIMVGFPSEREENFQNTIRLIKEVNPLKVHIFPYSLRNGTVASNFREALNPDVVKERISRIKDISRNCSLIYKQRFLQRKMDVLVEGGAKENQGYWQGYTHNYIKVGVKSEVDLKNKLIPLQLRKINKGYVLADLC